MSLSKRSLRVGPKENPRLIYIDFVYFLDSNQELSRGNNNEIRKNRKK